VYFDLDEVVYQTLTRTVPVTISREAPSARAHRRS